MPEAAVDEHGDFARWENDIRSAGKILSMKSKSEPHRMRRFPHCDLGLVFFDPIRAIVQERWEG
jgi:hypothetical protein